MLLWLHLASSLQPFESGSGINIGDLTVLSNLLNSGGMTSHGFEDCFFQISLSHGAISSDFGDGLIQMLFEVWKVSLDVLQKLADVERLTFFG